MPTIARNNQEQIIGGIGPHAAAERCPKAQKFLPYRNRKRLPVPYNGV